MLYNIRVFDIGRVFYHCDQYGWLRLHTDVAS